MSCYSADLVMRQYNRVNGDSRPGNSYHNLQKVYTIILFEESPAACHALPDSYIHYGKTTFNTGLQIELLQEYCLVSLDIFREFHYDKDRNELSGWLSFFTTQSVADAQQLVMRYPWLKELYEDAARLSTNTEEVLNMFSEALHILDQNTVKLMIEQEREKVKFLKAELEDTQKINAVQEAELDNAKRINAAQEAELDNAKRINAAQKAEIARLQKLLAEQTK